MKYTVVSGMQTGADQGGLEAAYSLGVETGGYAPRGFETEEGPRPDLARKFKILDNGLSLSKRTKLNVAISDITLIFGKPSAGSNLTKKFCNEIERPFLWIPQADPDKLYDAYMKIKTLPEPAIRLKCVINVAGNRESIYPGIQEKTKEFMIHLLKALQK